MRGNRGYTTTTTVFLDDILPFLKGYKTVRCQKFISNYASNRAPFTGKKYLHFLFQLFNIEQVKEFFCMFEKSSPYEVLYLHQVGQISNRRRIENPKENFPEMYDKAKMRQYNLKEFGTNGNQSLHLELKVGKVAEKKYSFFEIEYVLNLEKLGECKEDTIDPSSGITAGQLSFHYHFQQHINGTRKENLVKGVDVEDQSGLESPSVSTIPPIQFENPNLEQTEEDFLEKCRKRLEERKNIKLFDFLNSFFFCFTLERKCIFILNLKLERSYA